MDKHSDMQIAVDLLSSLIAQEARDEVHVPRSALKVAGDSLTKGWSNAALKDLASRTTTKFRKGLQYDYVVTYSPETETFIGMSGRARDELIRRLSR